MKQDDGWFHWPALYLNHRIAISLLKEGLVLEFEHCKYVLEITVKHNFRESVDFLLTPFEEYIFSMICTKVSGKNL
jgi:hypothetical protein